MVPIHPHFQPGCCGRLRDHYADDVGYDRRGPDVLGCLSLSHQLRHYLNDNHFYRRHSVDFFSFLPFTFVLHFERPLREWMVIIFLMGIGLIASAASVSLLRSLSKPSTPALG